MPPFLRWLLMGILFNTVVIPETNSMESLLTVQLTRKVASSGSC